jgi:hypothetical protein
MSGCGTAVCLLPYYIGFSNLTGGDQSLLMPSSMQRENSALRVELLSIVQCDEFYSKIL